MPQAARCKILFDSQVGYFIATRSARPVSRQPYTLPMQWYYAIGDQRNGPVDQAEFERLVQTGIIKSDTLVWRQGMANWQPYAGVVGGIASAAPAFDDGTEVCAVSGKRYPRRDMINYEGKWISAEHRDAFFQRMREGISQPAFGDSPVPGAFGYGGFWRRFLAWFLDWLIMTVVTMPLGVIGGLIFGAKARQPADLANIGPFLLTQSLIMLVTMAIAIAYEVFFIRKFDATPGKMALGVRVLRADGSKMSVGRIIGRYFGKILSGLILAIGYIIAAFDDQKQALHDRICDTRVVKTR